LVVAAGASYRTAHLRLIQGAGGLQDIRLSIIYDREETHLLTLLNALTCIDFAEGKQPAETALSHQAGKDFKQGQANRLLTAPF